MILNKPFPLIFLPRDRKQSTKSLVLYQLYILPSPSSTQFPDPIIQANKHGRLPQYRLFEETVPYQTLHH